MTSATATERRTSPAGERHHSDRFTGTGTLVRFMLRRDRVRLPAWAGGFGLFAVYLVSALPTAYALEDLENMGQMFRAPVSRMIIGPGYGLDDPTYARVIANGYGLYFALLAALMSILLISRHTRVEEQTGRAELLRANVVGRHAVLTAALVMAVLTNAAAAAAAVLVLVGIGGFAVGGSVLFAAGFAVTGLAFAGVATVTVQVTEYSRAASGMAGAVLGAAFVIRGGGDMAREGGSLLSWLSPLGWPQQTAPFVLDRWWPLLLSLGFAVAMVALGFMLSTRRDLGASFYAVRGGHFRAAPWLGTPLGLAARLQRASIIGWTVGMAIGGLVYGAFVDAMLAAIGDMPDVFVELFGGAEQMVDGYLAYMAEFMAFFAAMFAILAVQFVRGEETGGRGEPVLATPVGRWTWLGSHLLVAAGGVVVLLGVTGAATAVGAALVTGDAGYLWPLTAAHLNQVPAVLVVLGIAALLFGVAPRAIALTWAVVAYGIFVGTFGPLLDLPGWTSDLSPFQHPAQMPVEAFEPLPLVLLTAVAVAAASVGLVAFRRRSVNGA